MTYDEFQQQIARAGLEIQEFAELVKMNRTSLYNYGNTGTVPSHWAIVAVLLRTMAEKGIDVREALSQVDILPKKPRGAGIGKFGGGKK